MTPYPLLLLVILPSDPPLSDLERLPTLAEAKRQAELWDRHAVWLEDLRPLLSPGQRHELHACSQACSETRAAWELVAECRWPYWTDWRARQLLGDLRRLLGPDRYTLGRWPQALDPGLPHLRDPSW